MHKFYDLTNTENINKLEIQWIFNKIKGKRFFL